MNKQVYWANRSIGKRGQGPYPNPVVSSTPPDKVKQGRVCTRKYVRPGGKDELTMRFLERGMIR